MKAKTFDNHLLKLLKTQPMRQNDKEKIKHLEAEIKKYGDMTSAMMKFHDQNETLRSALKNVMEDLRNMACSYGGYSFDEGKKHYFKNIASYSQAEAALKIN